MRPIILSAMLLTLATPVLAQVPPPDAHDDHRDDRGGDHRGGNQRDGDHGDQHGGDHGDNRGGDHRGDQGQRGDDRGGNHGDDRGGNRGGDHRDDRGFRGDDRGGFRGDDRGGDRHDFRDDRRAYGDGDRFARFHGDAFAYPRGYGYRAYGIGAVLPRVFFDQRYYIADPYAYRLPPAFRGTHWVRVGPDALLVRYDGRVVRVIRGLFY